MELEFQQSSREERPHEGDALTVRGGAKGRRTPGEKETQGRPSARVQSGFANKENGRREIPSAHPCVPSSPADYHR